MSKLAQIQIRKGKSVKTIPEAMWKAMQKSETYGWSLYGGGIPDEVKEIEEKMAKPAKNPKQTKGSVDLSLLKNGVRTISDKVGDLTQEEATALLEAEKKGDGRSTVISLLQKHINSLSK